MSYWYKNIYETILETVIITVALIKVKINLLSDTDYPGICHNSCRKLYLALHSKQWNRAGIGGGQIGYSV